MQDHQPLMSEPPVSAGFVGVNGGQLYYEIAGDGHPLIMVQKEDFLDRRIWDEQFATFACAYRVVRYDGRGYGKSPSSTELYKQTDDLEQVMRTLMLESAYLLDFGGNIALDFVHEHPTDVDALLIASPSISPYLSSDEAMAALPQTLERLAPLTDALLQQDTQRAVDLIVESFHLSSSFPSASAQHLRAIVFDNLQAVLQPGQPPIPDTKAFDTRNQWFTHIQTPMLLLVGENAPSEIQSSAQTLIARIAGVQTREIAHAQFLLHIEQPEEFNHAVLTFLQSLGEP